MTNIILLTDGLTYYFYFILFLVRFSAFCYFKGVIKKLYFQIQKRKNNFQLHLNAAEIHYYFNLLNLIKCSQIAIVIKVIFRCLFLKVKKQQNYPRHVSAGINPTTPLLETTATIPRSKRQTQSETRRVRFHYQKSMSLCVCFVMIIHVEDSRRKSKTAEDS